MLQKNNGFHNSNDPFHNNKYRSLILLLPLMKRQHSSQLVTHWYDSAHRPAKNVNSTGKETFISSRKILCFLRRITDTTNSFRDDMILAAY